MFTVKAKIRAEARERQISVPELFMVLSRQLAIFKILKSKQDPQQTQVAALLDKHFSIAHSLLRTIHFEPLQHKSYSRQIVSKIERDIKFQEKRAKRAQALKLLKQNTAKWVL